jgi:hypothetical protein
LQNDRLFLLLIEIAWDVVIRNWSGWFSNNFSSITYPEGEGLHYNQEIQKVVVGEVLRLGEAVEQQNFLVAAAVVEQQQQPYIADSIGRKLHSHHKLHTDPLLRSTEHIEQHSQHLPSDFLLLEGLE